SCINGTPSIMAKVSRSRFIWISSFTSTAPMRANEMRITLHLPLVGQGRRIWRSLAHPHQLSSRAKRGIFPRAHRAGCADAERSLAALGMTDAPYANALPEAWG